MRKKEWLLISIILLLALALRFILLDSIPGLHFDEARYGLTAIDIIELKHVPLVGQRAYIGNFTPLLVASTFLLFFSQNIFTLRFVFAFSGLLTVILVFLSLKKTDKKLALISALITAVLPFLVIFSRIAFEFSLIPFFSALGFYLFLKFQKTKKDKYLYLLFLYLGFGTQNQMAFAIIAIFFIFFVLKELLHKKQIIKIFFSFLILALTLTPLLIENFREGFPLFKTFSGTNKISQQVYLIFIKDFVEVLDGKLIYLRTAGSTLNYLPYVNSSLFIVAVLWLIIKAKCDLRKFLLLFLIYYFITAPLFFASFGFTYSLRYFLTFFPIGTIPIGIMLSDLISYRKFFIFLVVLFVAINIAQLYNNFFYNIYLNDGGFTTFDIGFPETSSHFIASFPKMAKILEEYKTVYFYEPVGFHDVEAILKFLLYGKTQLIKVNEIDEKGKLYFAFDFNDENRTYERIINCSDGFEINKIIINNRRGKTMLKLYIIE